MDHYFLITGAPGSGKTTLLERLRRLGFAVVDEVARQILAEQRSVGGTGTPEQDPALFTQLMLSRARSRYREHRTQKGFVLFDRGLPDILGYARLFGLPEDQIEKAAREHPYNRIAFLTPVLPQFYQQDDERRMTYDEARAFGEKLAEGYRELGYELVELPADTPEARCSFIREKLQVFSEPAR